MPNSTDLDFYNQIRGILGVNKVRRPTPTKIILPVDDLLASAWNWSDDKQRITLDKMLKLGWQVTKVTGYGGRPVLVFVRSTGSIKKVAVIKPGGDFEVNKAGRKTVRAALPR